MTTKKIDVIGMWVFLASEVCLFLGIFIAFMIYQHFNQEAFHEATLNMSFWSGTINTFILLTSSLTVALSLAFYKAKKIALSLGSLSISIFLGVIFLGIKGEEYVHHFIELTSVHTKPGIKLFYLLYFIMTGVHAFHMIIGIMVLIFVATRVYRRHYDFNDPTGLEVAGLYWHFVDVIWVFLYPLLYLGNLK